MCVTLSRLVYKMQCIWRLLVIKLFLIIQVGIKPVPNQKRQFPEKREVNVKKTVVIMAKTEANTQAPAREPAPEPVTPSWASDHNYNAVKPERTAAISPALLFKCMYGLGIFLNNHIFFEYPSILGSAKPGSLGFGGFFLPWHQATFLHLQRFTLRYTQMRDTLRSFILSYDSCMIKSLSIYPVDFWMKTTWLSLKSFP